MKLRFRRLANDRSVLVLCAIRVRASIRVLSFNLGLGLRVGLKLGIRRLANHRSVLVQWRG